MLYNVIKLRPLVGDLETGETKKRDRKGFITALCLSTSPPPFPCLEAKSKEVWLCYDYVMIMWVYGFTALQNKTPQILVLIQLTPGQKSRWLWAYAAPAPARCLNHTWSRRRGVSKAHHAAEIAPFSWGPAWPCVHQELKVNNCFIYE